MNSADQAWLDEFASCARTGMAPELCRHNADHAAELQKALLAGSLKSESRHSPRHLSRRASAFTAVPTNVAELRQVVELEAAKLRDHRWWFAVVALANVRGAGMPGLRLDMLGPKLAARLLGLQCMTDWVPSALRRYDREAYAAAVACGEKLTAEWGEQMPVRLRKVA